MAVASLARYRLHFCSLPGCAEVADPFFAPADDPPSEPLLGAATPPPPDLVPDALDFGFPPLSPVLGSGSLGSSGGQLLSLISFSFVSMSAWACSNCLVSLAISLSSSL